VSDTETSAKRMGNLDEGGSGVNGMHEDSEVDVNQYWLVGVFRLQGWKG
jgi:hypothetical protein